MDDAHPDWERLFEYASGQAGYFTVPQARDSGFSSALLAHHARSGRLRRMGPRIYRFGQYPSSSREEVMRAWLAAGPEAVISHESALDLLGLSDVIPDGIHVTVPRSFRWLRAAEPGVVLHTVTDPVRRDEVMTRAGMRVTSPTRTILDFAEAGGAPDQVVQGVRDAVDHGVVDSDELRSRAAERGARVRDLIDAVLASMKSCGSD